MKGKKRNLTEDGSEEKENEEPNAKGELMMTRIIMRASVVRMC